MQHTSNDAATAPAVQQPFSPRRMRMRQHLLPLQRVAAAAAAAERYGHRT